MAVVLLHELLDREKMRAVGEPKLCGQPDLLIEGQNLLRHAGPDMKKRTNAQEKLPRLLDGPIVGLRKDAAIGQFTNRRRLIPRQSRPTVTGAGRAIRLGFS